MEKLDLALIFQIGTCVSNMDQLMTNWRKYFNVNENSIIRKSTKEIFDRGEYHSGIYLDKPMEFFHMYYRFDMGGLDMELIEPITKELFNPYSDFLFKGGNGIHHLGVKFRNRPVLVDTMKKMGIPVFNYGYQGKVEPDISKRADCYFYDLNEKIGMVFEAGGAVVGPLAYDPRSGNDLEALAKLNKQAVRPNLPELEEDPTIEKMDIEKIFQLAIVTHDLDCTLINFKKYFEVDESTIRPGEVKDVERSAHISFGGLDILIVEPILGLEGNTYSEFMSKSGPGIHHVTAKFADKSKLIRNMEKLGIAPEQGEECTYDVRDLFGYIIKADDNIIGPVAEL